MIIQYFAEGIYPHILKIAQVSPAHKHEDTLTVTKYHSISLLSIFSQKY